MLESRTHALAAAGVDPTHTLELNRLDGAGHWLGEIQGSHRWTPLLEPALRTFDDRWMSFSSDPLGLVDADRREVVFVHGLALGDEPKWAVLTGWEVPERSPRPLRGVANVLVEPWGNGAAATVKVEQVLTIDSGTLPSRMVALTIPHREEPFWPGFVRVASVFTLQQISTVDGAVLSPLASYGPPRETEGTTGLWALPASRSGPLRLVLKWEDRWPIGHNVNLWEWAVGEIDICPSCDRAKLGTIEPEWSQLGQVSSGRYVWAHVGTREPESTELRMASTHDRWRVALGAGTSVRAAGANDWTVASGPPRAPAVGRIDLDLAPAVPPFPAFWVDPALDWPNLEVFLRGVAHFFQEALPNLPHAELEIVRGPDQLILECVDTVHPEFSWDRLPVEVTAGPGQLVVRFRKYVPGSEHVALQLPVVHEVERALAQGLARQWWDQPRYGQRDAWISQAASGYFRDRFVEEAYGADVAGEWRKFEERRLHTVHALPHRGPYPLTPRLEPWTPELGARFFALLEWRIGEEPLLRGMRAFLDGTVHTTEALADAISASSAHDVRPWFAAHVEAGIRPKLDVQLVRRSSTLEIELTASPPVGTFEVPVRVEGRRSPRTFWALIRDGSGHLSVDRAGEIHQVIVDPTSWFGPTRTVVAPGRSPGERTAPSRADRG